MTVKTAMTLVSFLGRARQDPKTGYRTARYRFANGAIHSTPFFGLALREVKWTPKTGQSFKLDTEPKGVS